MLLHASFGSLFTAPRPSACFAAWPAGSSPRRGGGRCAGCRPARDCRGAGRMSGRTSSSPVPGWSADDLGLEGRSWWPSCCAPAMAADSSPHSARLADPATTAGRPLLGSVSYLDTRPVTLMAPAKILIHRS